MGYTKEAVKGVSWAWINRFVIRVITFFRLAIIARILAPSQFGIFSIVALVLSLAEIFTETGINIFLIQGNRDLKEYVNTAWVVSIIRGFVISILIILFAPFIAMFFKTPQMYNYLLLLSIAPIIRGFINPSEIKFQKDIHFHKDFYFRSSIFLVESLAAVVLSWQTHSVTGLIWAFIVSALFEVILSFAVATPRPNFSFSKLQFRQIIKAGKWITFAGVFSYLFQNSDNVAVGRLLGTMQLGFYDNAYKISLLPITEIGDIVSQVTLPVYVRIMGDKQRLRRAYWRTVFAVSLITLPIGIVFYFFPSQIITIILGSKWLPAVPVLKVLALFGVVRAISNTSSSLFYSLNKQNYISFTTAVSFVVLLVLIVPLTMQYGIVGAAYTAFIATIASVPFIGYLIYKVL